MLSKPIAEACFRNQQPILDTLQTYLGDTSCSVFEIGSGTGQHAVYVADHLAQIRWQPSDMNDALDGIRMWVQDAVNQNVLEPVELDVDNPFPVTSSYDAVFTANTIHFVSALTAENVLRQAAIRLKESGLCFIYGPFNEEGFYTSEGNRRLDEWLKTRSPDSGIKDLSWVEHKAKQVSMTLANIHDMPANNKMLVFKKDAQ